MSLPSTALDTSRLLKPGAIVDPVFRPSAATSTVVYALPVDPIGRRPPPSPGLESFVVGPGVDLNQRWKAPYYTTYSPHSLRAYVRRTYTLKEGQAVAEHLGRLCRWIDCFDSRQWLLAVIREPSAIAGDGTAYVRSLAARRAAAAIVRQREARGGGAPAQTQPRRFISHDRAERR